MTPSAEQIWDTSLGQLQLLVPRSSYDTWLKGTAGLALDGDLLTVRVPTPFAAEWLERRMYQLIHRTVAEVATRPLQIRFQIGSPQQNSRSTGALTSEASASQGLSLDDDIHQPLSTRLPNNGTFNPRYRFQNFVIGTCNQLAHAAASAVAQHPGEQYNPLFIYSGVGLGKTHLLFAIASVVAKRNLHPLYVTAEQFTNDFIQAIRERKTEDFRTKYRSADVLLLDDIQFLSGKEQTQESFFHTFNDLHNANRQIVVASDRPPKAVALLEERLRSRFEWGLLTDIQPPGLETRLAIVHDKAAALGATLSEDVAMLIARRASHNVRELEGCINRIAALAQFLGKAISAELAAMALADITPAISSTSLDPSRVVAQLAAYYQLPPEVLCTRQHDRKTTLPQRIVMYILSETLHQPARSAAALLGHWHVRTVRNAVKEITERLAVDTSLQQEINTIHQELNIIPG